MNRESLINIIDMRHRPDNTYKFILIYQDFTTQCCILRPLSSIHADEVALTLVVDIFKTLGVPSILKCMSNYEFACEVGCELLRFGRNINVVQVQIHENHTNYNVEIVYQMLRCWLTANDTNEWSNGLHLIQFYKNLKTFYEVIHLPIPIERVRHLNEKHPNVRDDVTRCSIQATTSSGKRQANISNETDLSLTIGNNKKKTVKRIQIEKQLLYYIFQ